MSLKNIFIVFFLIGFSVPATFISAHQSGCHRWHSCPSDSGSYVCGDLGYYSECPRGSSTVTTYTYTAPTPTPSPTPTPKPVVAKKVAVKKVTTKVVTKIIASKEVPAVVDRLFRSVYGRKPSVTESTYWKMRARTDKKTEALLKAEMQLHKKKGIKH